MLRRAQLILILAALVPTVLATATSIVLLVAGSGSVTIVGGALLLAFATSTITGAVLVSIFVSRGASLARVQNDFLSSVSHELRTPITSMRMFIETLRDDRVTDPEERKKCLATVHQELSRLDSLVARLIDLSRIESGRQAFERKAVAVEEVVQGALAAFEAARLGDGAALELDVQVEPGLTVVGDRDALTQALVNLLTNAWKYTPAHKKEIGLRAGLGEKGQVVIAVRDNGSGVPPEERRLIFEEFERGKAAVGSGMTGSGLGLAIVRAIVRHHRGKVELESAPGHGAVFRILLPRAERP